MRKTNRSGHRSAPIQAAHAAVLAAAALLFCTLPSGAQEPAANGAASGVVTMPASRQYERGGLWRALFGKTWRDVWAVPFTVPVLDFGSFAGGLDPFKKGGNQSKTLRMHGADGITYIFRSTDKDIQNALPPDFRGTLAGKIVQDQTSSFHPAGSVASATLQQALGLLTAVPQFVFITDDPRLGKFREDFKNTLGTIEERPDEGEMSAQYAGAKKIVSTDKLLEELEQSTRSRIDSREYLKARLLDFMIGDTDRGADQWRWARYDRDDGSRVYRPIARDRDYAFMRTEGFLTSMAASVYPKLTRFQPKFPKLNSLVFMTAEFDRNHLIDIPRTAWDSVVTDVQRRITDELIDRAIARIPEPQRRLSGDVLRAGLRGRRAALPVIAHQLYTMVVQDADIFGSDDDERADIDRNPDGSVRVRLYRNENNALVFDRTFVTNETQAIYVHLERGNDRAVVRGDVAESIQLRVIGGEGDDVMIDSGYVAKGDETHFYDASGQNALVGGRRTDISRKPFVTIPPKRSLDNDENAEPEKNPRKIAEERRGRYQDLLNAEMGYVEQKTKAESMRMWGKKSGLTPFFTYRDGPGAIVGIGPTTTEYGFRRRPYEWRTEALLLFGTASGGFGVQLTAERFFEASPWSIAFFGHASQIESNRFFGYGNDTPFGDLDATLIMRDEVLAAPSINYSLGTSSRVSVGPIVRLTRPHVPDDGPAGVLRPLGTDKYGQVGARADFVMLGADRREATQRGLDLVVGGSGYPAALDVSSAFGEAHAVAKLFVPLGRPTLALRAGGKRVWGEFPLHEAAFIGAEESVRGYRWNRFAGDAAAFGTAELRVPVARIELLARGDLGLIGFIDAGRVWMDGTSAGDWHTGTGGGLWFGTMGHAFSATYAKGEEGRAYFTLGLPF